MQADDGLTFGAAIMIKFDDLPHTNRTLLLATLELEIAEAKCTNILQLAHKRNLPIQEIWRDICRKTGQPRCTVPAPVMVSRDQWLESATSGRLDSTTATSALDPPTPTSLKEGSVNAGTIAVPVVLVKQPRAAPVPAFSAQRAQNLRAPLIAGLVAILALGVGFLVLVASPNSTVAPQASLQIPNAKPDDVLRGATIIRDQSGESAKPEFDPNSVPPPQGTIRRLEGISKSFWKR